MVKKGDITRRSFVKAGTVAGG
ncbi:twin-arginine translocation signal domain-containing protein [Pseudoxanthomonas sp. SGD-10]|nr:twin-arginine translocation signal domain-containing protein [Pseudoxanthomonas sp. SGD-10]